jgi:hypothetical protein
LSSESKRAVALKYFSHRAASYLSAEGRGCRGGKVELAEALDMPDFV